MDFLGIVLLLCLLAYVWPGDKDDTDSATARSGMKLYIDARTGCHYLSAPFGSLTPRLDADGKQICDKREASQ